MLFGPGIGWPGAGWEQLFGVQEVQVGSSRMEMPEAAIELSYTGAQVGYSSVCGTSDFPVSHLTRLQHLVREGLSDVQKAQMMRSSRHPSVNTRVLQFKLYRARPVRALIRICFPLCSHWKQLAVPLILE